MVAGMIGLGSADFPNLLAFGPSQINGIGTT
jgi:hypothetical protein